MRDAMLAKATRPDLRAILQRHTDERVGPPMFSRARHAAHQLVAGLGRLGEAGRLQHVASIKKSVVCLRRGRNDPAAKSQVMAQASANFDMPSPVDEAACDRPKVSVADKSSGARGPATSVA